MAASTKSALIYTHIHTFKVALGPNDSVKSVIHRVQSNLESSFPGHPKPLWRYLAYKNKLLPQDAKIVDVVTEAPIELYYIAPPPIPITSFASATSPPVNSIPSSINSSMEPNPPPPSIDNLPPLVEVQGHPASSSDPVLSTNIPKLSALPPNEYFATSSIDSLQAMGFSDEAAKQALLLHNHVLSMAIGWLADRSPDTPLTNDEINSLDNAIIQYWAAHE